MHRNLKLALVAVAWVGVVAAQDVASYRATFEASLAQIEAAFTQRTAALEVSYAKSLEALHEQHRVAGNLSGTLATKAEVERFAAEKCPPETPSGHVAVAALQEKLKQALAQPRLDRARQTAALADQYDQALDRLLRAHVVAGQLPDAQAVQAERDRAKELPTVTQAREAVAACAIPKPPTPVAAAPAPVLAGAPSATITMKAAKELIAGMEALSEADWRKLPGSTVTVHADPGKVCDTEMELGPGDVVLLVPHPRDQWTRNSGRSEECDFRGLRGGPLRPHKWSGTIPPMALCMSVGGSFPQPVEGNYLVVGQGKLDLSPGLRAIPWKGADPKGSIRVKVIQLSRDAAEPPAK